MTMSEARQAVGSAHTGMLLWALIVGLSFPAVGLMSEGLPPLLLTAMRFTIASLALWPLVRRTPAFWPSRQGLVLYVLMGLCTAGFFGAMFWAAHRATALSMSTLYVSVPLLAYGLGRLFGVERRAGGLLAILALGAAGALALAWAGKAGQAGGLQLGAGETAFFLGCLGSALYPVLTKWGLARGWLPDGAGVRTFWSLVVGAALVGLMGLAAEAPRALAAMTVSDVLLVAYLGVFSSGVTYWLMQRGTGALTPGAVTAYTYLVPFVSVVLVVVGEPERMGWQWVPGSVMVVLAIALLLRRPVDPPATPAAPRRCAASS